MKCGAETQSNTTAIKEICTHLFAGSVVDDVPLGHDHDVIKEVEDLCAAWNGYRIQLKQIDVYWSVCAHS